MNLKNIILVCSLLCLIFACSCNKGANKTAEVTEVVNTYQKISPDFNSDSAYHYVDRQVAFGPRVPNSEAHKLCGDYLVSELKRFGAEVIEQKVDLKAYNGTVLQARNIIGSYDQSNPNRILLFAHWDSRPFADRDPDKNLQRSPILGANDGGSGVGVLLEIARIIRSDSLPVGIDIIFFDAEDYGVPVFETQILDNTESWCLGSQYWSKNPHVANYKAKFGILLDMVGAENATFYKEYYSQRSAKGVLVKIWNTARNLGYGRYFIDKDGGGIMDDHIPVIENRRIPSVDIIQQDLNVDHNFGWYWHTSKDDMNVINKETLKAVGQTVLEVIYREK